MTCHISHSATRVRRLPRSRRLNLLDRQPALEKEYDLPLRDLVAGYFSDGESLRSTAAILDVSIKSLGAYARANHLAPPKVARTLQAHSDRHRRRIRSAARRRHRNLHYQGITLSAAEWSERTGISRNLISHRIRRGWSVQAALGTPALTPSEIAHRRNLARRRKP